MVLVFRFEDQKYCTVDVHTVLYKLVNPRPVGKEQVPWLIDMSSWWLAFVLVHNSSVNDGCASVSTLSTMYRFNSKLGPMLLVGSHHHG